MKPFVVWPVPYSCGCCVVLSEIIHTNGNVSTKLEIHGRLGMIRHAILEIRQSTYAKRKQAGFFLVPPDPRSIFYDALCVRLDSNENRTTNDYTQPPVATNSGANGMNQAEVENDELDRNPSLSVQRKRTTMLTLQDLAQFFHLPIEKASKKLRLSPTVVKKICRRYGVFRWPYRKKKSEMAREVFAS
ncbi:hypothetical protein EZV62_007913 [Acer yangbiense]|uniref:RWP-RK domain-containing protein n=1 Tax=Acer yangbiense TaxID=1000413 RepID=A0A5C7IC35_9ROSI|nr:hypothetical protein EZV62_007913 [Acer yangbiense]